MRDVVLDELGKFIKERIKENEELFTKDELTTINENYILIKKIYILGIVNTQSIK